MFGKAKKILVSGSLVSRARSVKDANENVEQVAVQMHDTPSMPFVVALYSM